MKKQESKAKSGEEIFEVLWDLKALSSVEKIYNYILQNSVQGAETVKKEIFDALDSLKIYPERFPPDPDLKSPYHKCLVRNFRIIYRIYDEQKQVLVLHVWNSKRSSESLFKEMNIRR
ncbi:MAG: hypothetical protein JWO06_1192 [Bacteroidota bacterium]|nr:hypothetical protein [Bacteroidota bacterium]